jgi:hypothetical protein
MGLPGHTVKRISGLAKTTSAGCIRGGRSQFRGRGVGDVSGISTGDGLRQPSAALAPALLVREPVH